MQNLKVNLTLKEIIVISNGLERFKKDQEDAIKCLSVEPEKYKTSIEYSEENLKIIKNLIEKLDIPF